MNYTNLLFYLAGLSVTFGCDELYLKDAMQLHKSIGNGDARNAIDRNTSTCMKTNAMEHDNPEQTVFWDLGGVHSIYSVHLMFKYNEKRQHGPFVGFSLYISETDVPETKIDQKYTLCYKDPPQLPLLDFMIKCAKVGRYVTFYIKWFEDDTCTFPAKYEINDGYTELCEVIVYGCNKSGVYEDNCYIPCPINCKDNLCQGTCYACKPGWTGSNCTAKCPSGYFGMDCKERCSGHCTNNESCHHILGVCPKGCKDGYIGTRCDDTCKDGYYGRNCSNVCPFTCQTCRHTDGLCSCKAGWMGPHCMKECTPGYFGMDCRERCIGHCLNNETCDHVKGKCPNGCQDGYIGTHCNSTCQDGYYGRNCSLVCSPNCKTCRHTDGRCTCKEGWIGPGCTTECTPGYFGMDCRERCIGHCLNNETCDNVKGVCLNGCQDGYIGTHCNNTCQDGYYGRNCSLVCSPNCKTCRHTDGRCTCKEGWIGPGCTTECLHSYGEDCQLPCSVHCINQTCNRFNGNCSFGSGQEIGKQAHLPIVSFPRTMHAVKIRASLKLTTKNSVYLKETIPIRL